MAVIGQTVAEELFPGQNPVGQTMRANGVNFEVLVEKGQTSSSTSGRLPIRGAARRRRRPPGHDRQRRERRRERELGLRWTSAVRRVTAVS